MIWLLILLCHEFCDLEKFQKGVEGIIMKRKEKDQMGERNTAKLPNEIRPTVASKIGQLAHLLHNY